MDDRFGEFEPQVGEIRAVRTFRVGPGGLLYPLFGTVPWTSGTNTARCRHELDAGADGAHPVPEPACTCGFYAYAGVAEAGDYPHSSHVLAVVACWGRVIAGTRGVRAEHSRVEALWTSDAVPEDLVRATAQAYPEVRMYTDRDRMVREHPATALDCYEPVASPLTRRRTVWWRTGALAALGVGSVAPLGWLGASAQGASWTLTAGLLALLVVTGRLHGGDIAARRRGLLLVATVLWLAAGLVGLAGGLLVRLPLAELALVGGLNARRARRSAATFPADVTCADDAQ